MTPLQQKHLDAIENDINVGSFEEVEDIKRASLQCTRITIEEKIELLKSIPIYAVAKTRIIDVIESKIEFYQNELKQLENDTTPKIRKRNS